MPTDYDKLAQCVYRHHDHAAFERIVEGWQDMVYRRALLVARGDADKATEFATEIFVAAWNGIIAGAYTPPFKAWMTVFVMRRCVDYLAAYRYGA